MQKKHIKKFNEIQNKAKLKIPQPNQIHSTNKKINNSQINKTILYYKQKKALLNNINIKKSRSIYKDSLDENISESKTNILIPDSLNNTKRSIKYNKIINISDNLFDSLNNKRKNDFSEKNKNEEETKKIDYRYYTNYPMKDYLINNQNSIYTENKKKKKYWLATYDKMMKKQKIIKILNYYSKDKKYEEKDIKEKLMEFKDFEIYFPQQSNHPLIKYKKNQTIFSKLYLLTLENLNILLSYMNRIKTNIKQNELDNIIIKGNYLIITENSNFKYNIVYYMGTFLNINIYGFSSLYVDYENKNIIHDLNSLPTDSIKHKFPSSKKIAKLVKILLNNFPKYNSDYFVSYLLPKIKYPNYIQKFNEIKNYIYSKNSAEIHHKLINSNCLAEVVAFTTSFTATSMMTPYSYSKNNFFNNKINRNTTKYKENINNTGEGNGEIGKYPTFISNNIYLIDKDKKIVNNKKAIDKNIMKVLYKKNEKEIKKNTNNIKMKYVKISLKKNILKNTKNRFKAIKNNKKETKNKSKTNTKKNVKNINNRTSNNIKSFNKSYNNKIKLEKYNIIPKYSLINNNIIENDLSKMSISKLINYKKKKSIKKPSILYDKVKAKNFFYNTEIQQKSFELKDKIKDSNNSNGEKKNLLLDSFDLNNYLIKNNINKKSIEKDKKKNKNKGIYVVDRRIQTDLQDDDSSIILLKNREIDDSKEFITPHSSKKKKYYH